MGRVVLNILFVGEVYVSWAWCMCVCGVVYCVWCMLCMFCLWYVLHMGMICVHVCFISVCMYVVCSVLHGVCSVQCIYL